MKSKIFAMLLAVMALWRIDYMKAIIRLIAMLSLIIMAALSSCQSAIADADAPVVLVRDERVLEAWARKLGLDQPLKDAVGSGGFDAYADWLRDCKPDFYTVDTNKMEPLQELWQAGLLEPFEPTETMLEEIASFPTFLQQVIREALITSDGKLLGYPVADWVICERPNFIGYWIPDAWVASPFKDMTPPSCFEEMLDFYEIYLDTPHDGFRIYYGIYETKSSFIWGLFVEPLLNSWIVLCEYACKPVIFNTPEFIALVERSQKLIPKLLKSDWSAKVNTRKRYLFAQNQMVGYSFNTKDTFTFANMIPLRVTADQPPLINLHLTLSCVMPGSEWASRASEVFTVLPEERFEVMRDITYCDELVYPDRIDMNALNEDNKKRKIPQWRNYTQEWIDSIQLVDQIVVPCALSENWTPNSQYSELMRALNKTFLEYKMKPEEFAAEMDRINAARISGAWDKDIWIEDMGD